MVADMQEEYSVPCSQPHSFNLLTAISCFIGKRVLCASMLPTIAWSQKRDDSREGGFGCFVIFYIRCVTLRGSSAPLCGSYLLYNHYLFGLGEGGYCCFCVLCEVVPSFHLSSLCTAQLICCIYCWRPDCAAVFM